jgi:KDO2-lipid IV(A) lauroyltransferase
MSKTNSKKITLREYLEYLLVLSVLNFSRLLPEFAVRALFRGFARIFYAFSSRRRNTALKNLQIVFPEKSKKERIILAKNSFLSLSETMAVSLLLATRRISDQRLLEMVEVADVENFNKIKEITKPAPLILSAHFGNWEILPRYFSLHKNKPVHVVSRKGNNRLIEERIVCPMRERQNISLFYKKNALMRIVRAIRKGEPCGFLIDQKLKSADGILIDFFGKPAPTTPAPALLQIKFKIPVFAAFLVRIAPQKYRFHCTPSILWEDNGKSREEQIEELTRIHQSFIEEMIRRYPEQWFWVHNRWNLPGNKRRKKRKKL